MKQLPLNWFDFVVIAFLVIGFFRGRKRGMSEELLPLLQWIATFIGCGLLYAPFSTIITQYAHLSQMFANIAAYLLLMIGFWGVFTLIKKAVGEKLLGSDLFGRLEYYLGMLAGMVRWCLILLCGISLFNARLVTDAELAKLLKEDEHLYGSNFFPRYGQVQRDVFRYSLTGPLVTNYLGKFIMEPAPYVDVMGERETIGGKKREREIEDVMKTK